MRGQTTLQPARLQTNNPLCGLPAARRTVRERETTKTNSNATQAIFNLFRGRYICDKLNFLMFDQQP